MKFWRKWITQAREIDRLTRELEFAIREKGQIESLLEREEVRTTILEKSLTSERNAHNKAVRRVSDIVCKQVGLPQHFVADAKETPEVQPIQYSPDEESDIRWMAEEQRQADIDSGYDAAPLDTYIALIREKGVRELLV